MSNIRQRRAPSPSRQDSYGQSSALWEIATEGSGENDFSSPRNRRSTYNPVAAHPSPRRSVPMYNPMAIQSTSSKSNANADFLRDNPLTSNYHNPPGYFTGSIHDKGDTYDVLRAGRSLPSMSPALIPDSAYRAYLSGKGPITRKRPGIDKIILVKIVGYFCIVGFIFLTFVGILIDTQPMFLQGVLPKNEVFSSNGRKTKTFYAINISERLDPAKNAYRGGLLYLLTAIICLGYAHNMHHFLFKKGWQQYRDIDDVHQNSDAILRSNEKYLPIHRQAYEDHNGFMLRAWQSISVKFLRLGIFIDSIWQARRRNRRRFAGAKDV